MIVQDLTDLQVNFDGTFLNFTSLSETLTVPSSANFPSSSPSRYTIELKQCIFVSGSYPITISGYTRKLTPNPAAGEFYIYPYTTSTSTAPLSYIIEFNSANAGASVTVNYYGVGSTLSKYNLNREITNAVTYSNQLKGLTLSNNGTDPNNDIDIAVGGCIDSTGVEIMKLTSGLTKRLDASWTVGTNQGGLDTGIKTNSTWYYVYIIKRIDTNVVDAIYSTNASSPTLPTNYTYFRKIGAVRTDGSGNILAFYQGVDRWIFWKTYQTDVNGSSQGTTRTAYTLTAPPNSIVNILVRITNASLAYFIITGGYETDQTPSTTFRDLTVNNTTDSGRINGVQLDGSSQLYADSTAASTTLHIFTLAWKVDL